VIDPEILAQVRRIQIRTSRIVNDVMVGGYTSSFRGTGIEFDEVREFVEGDDPRTVDWNVTARTGRPHIKKFMEERELTVLFLLDASASTRFGTVQREVGSGLRTVRDVAAEFCACMALAASRNNDKAGMIAFTDQIERYVPAKKGSRHVLRLIREVLALEPKGMGSDLTEALEYAGRVQRKRSIVFVISDFLTDGYQQSLRLLARRHDVVAVRIRDPKTQELPRAGLLSLRDLETGQPVLVDTSSRRVQAAHQERMVQLDAGYAEVLQKAGVDSMDLTTDASVSDPIVRFFRMREMRGAHR
jgi:uncharacterized protein (DUF58 family)